MGVVNVYITISRITKKLNTFNKPVISRYIIHHKLHNVGTLLSIHIDLTLYITTSGILCENLQKVELFTRYKSE